MPSIVVDPYSSPVDFGGGPIINGMQFKRPTSRSETWPRVGSSQELANGSSRTYTKGRRRVVELSWAKLTPEELATLLEATEPAYVTYANDSTQTPVVMSTGDGPDTEAVPRTVPVRHSASVTLTARDVTP